MSSTSSRARSVAGPAGSNGPATAPSWRARSTRGGAKSSPPGIPAASCTPTSGISPEIVSSRTLAISPTSSSEALPASRSAGPTPRERALRTITSSGNGSASSSKSDLFGARLRIALAQELKASTGWSMRWVKEATPRGYAWWVLRMPARTMRESECGLLLPTPRASDIAAGGNRSGDRKDEMSSMARWARETLPTPMGGSRAERGGTPMDASAWARERMAKLIPTPRASDTHGVDHPREGRKNGLDLPGTLYPMLGTPRSSAGYDSDEFGPGAAPNPRKLIFTMLPTPQAHDTAAPKTAEQIKAMRARAKPRKNGGPPGISNLNEKMNSMLPTPIASPSRSARASPETMGKNSRPLSETSGHLGLTGTADSPVSQRRALLLGLVCWMMGQGPDFLLACATVPLPRSATRSSTRSRKRSAGQ